MIRHTRPRTRVAAQSLVEFAMVAPLFLLMLFGVLEGGRLLWTSHELSNGVREGARLAMVGGSKAATPVSQSDVEARVQNTTAGLNPDSLTVAVSNLGGNPGEKTVVSATYNFQPVVAMVFGAGTIQLSARSEIIIQH
jgi:Flp pilus assembly protein TadG